MARQFLCPTCGRRIEWTDAYPYRPFCSERCRLIDLGDWLTERNAIPGEAADDAAGAEPTAGPEGEDGPTGTPGRA
jgi:endogenous inhibitor of DNA gyrase (YacG/DUF329 family)